MSAAHSQAAKRDLLAMLARHERELDGVQSALVMLAPISFTMTQRKHPNALGGMTYYVSAALTPGLRGSGEGDTLRAALVNLIARL